MIAWMNVCVIWGTTYLAIRIGVGHLPPMLFAGVRWLVAGVAMTAFLRWRGNRLPRGKELVHLGVVGLALLGCANGLVVFAEQWIPSGLTALLLAANPLLMTSMESMLPKGARLNVTTIAGLILGLCGILFIFWDDIRYFTDRENIIGIVEQGCVVEPERLVFQHDGPKSGQHGDQQKCQCAQPGPPSAACLQITPSHESIT